MRCKYEREREREREIDQTSPPTFLLVSCTRYIYQRAIETRFYNYPSPSSSLGEDEEKWYYKVLEKQGVVIRIGNLVEVDRYLDIITKEEKKMVIQNKRTLRKEINDSDISSLPPSLTHKVNNTYMYTNNNNK